MTPDLPILIADDDAVARRVLVAVMQQAGYRTVVVEDGLAALEALVAPNGPRIAVIDWMMPGLNGPEVCARLRATDMSVRPYVIVLSGKSHKEDAAAALDSGADDFVVKPFNKVEFLARLRVAERMIQWQLGLREKRLRDVVALSGTHGDAAAAVNFTPSPPRSSSVDVPPPPRSSSPQSIPGARVVEQLTGPAISRLGWGMVRITDSSPAPALIQPHFTAWRALVVPKAPLWIDVLLTLSNQAAAEWRQRSASRRPDTTLEAFLCERLGRVTTTVANALVPSYGHALQPMDPECRAWDQLPLPLEAQPGTHRFSFAFPELEARVDLQLSASPVTWKVPAQLASGDVVAAVFPPPERSAVPLFNRGVVLSSRYITKTQLLAETALKELEIPVYVPTATARWFAPTGVLEDVAVGI